MTLRQASNELTKALGKFVNFVYKKSPDYNNVMTIDELWSHLDYNPEGVGNIYEDALALIDYVKERNSTSSFDELYGGQRSDVVASQVGEFLDAVQSMVEGRSAEQESTVRFMADSEFAQHAKEQLIAHQDEINKMDVVARVQSEGRMGKQVSDLRADLQKHFYTKSGDYTVDREGFGLVHYDRNALAEAVKYINSDAEYAAFLASERVIKRGKLIDHHIEHKGRANVESFSFAAPVELNGKRGNEVVVVQRTNRNKPHCVRILMPDGSGFVLDPIEKADHPDRAGINDARPQRMQSAYEDIITDNNRKSNTSANFSLDDDYMPLAEKYDAGVATDAEIAEMQRDVEEAATAAGFPAMQYDPVIYDANGEVVPLSERFSQDFTGNRYTVDNDYDELLKKYGAIEQGREPRARDVQVPKQTNDHNRVSQWIRSLVESGKLTDVQAAGIV